MILDIFVGTPQSKYAALAILSVIFVVSMVILLGKNQLPLSQKFAFILLIFLVSVPSILLTLFQLTCIVTGSGFQNKRWWCSIYAWVISIIIVLYCIILVISAILSLASGASALEDVKQSDIEKFKLRENFSNQVAEEQSASAVESKPPTQQGFVGGQTGPVMGGESVPSPLVLEPSVAHQGTASKAKPSAPAEPFAQKKDDMPMPDAFSPETFSDYASVEGFNEKKNAY